MTCWPEPLAEEHLRLAAVDRVGNEANHVERQLRERAAHLVEAVLRLDDDLVEAVVERPDFLLFGEGAEVALATPVLPGAADPLVEHTPAVELNDVFELEDEIGELRVGLGCPELVRHLERYGHDRRAIVGQSGLGHQDLVVAIGQPVDDFGRGLLAGEVEKELLDVLDLERALLKPILPNQVFHSHL